MDEHLNNLVFTLYLLIIVAFVHVVEGHREFHHKLKTAKKN